MKDKLNPKRCEKCEYWTMGLFWERFNLGEKFGECSELPNEQFEVKIYTGHDE